MAQIQQEIPVGSNTPDANTDPDQPEGYQILIAVDQDGKITVGVSDGDGDADDGDMQSATDIKAALTIALDIYRNDGQISAPGEAPADQMQAGYGENSGGQNG